MALPQREVNLFLNKNLVIKDSLDQAPHEGLLFDEFIFHPEANKDQWESNRCIKAPITSGETILCRYIQKPTLSQFPLQVSCKSMQTGDNVRELLISIRCKLPINRVAEHILLEYQIPEPFKR